VSTEKFCPGCGVSDVGGPIPADIVHHYVPWDIGKQGKEAANEWLKTNEWPTWQRFHGIEVRGAYDGILIWQCPDCDHLWPRFSKENWETMHNRAVAHIKVMEESKDDVHPVQG